MRAAASEKNPIYLGVFYESFSGFCNLTGLLETYFLIYCVHSFYINSKNIESMKLNGNIGKKTVDQKT